MTEYHAPSDSVQVHAGSIPVPQSAAEVTSENVHLLVPQRKLETEKIELLHNVDVQIWTPIISDLLEWTQDPNWPTAGTTMDLLTSTSAAIEAAIPHVANILADTSEKRDDEWRDVMLRCFVFRLPKEYQMKMYEDLQRFHEGITDESEADYEWREDVAHLIRDIARWVAADEGGWCEVR
ncbi:hypothetical protein H2198_009481 [Neophaeococcomyces mojaviensis]|uniref:Uncharacterized protein n=1 Tax=Neophaeococcomyces mojaviensis TaxID=3383035 RepID=A0ACC2ZUC5_9EURO|nr:hypothetical protein H2198_009481 [Knufia sp. JES_112]